MKKKCICSRYMEGFVNLKCKVHNVMPKIDKKFEIDNSLEDGEVLTFNDNFFEPIT